MIRRLAFAIIVIVLFRSAILSGTVLAVKDGQVEKAPGTTSLGEPFWRGKMMENEPVLFIQERGQTSGHGKAAVHPARNPPIMARIS